MSKYSIKELRIAKQWFERNKETANYAFPDIFIEGMRQVIFTHIWILEETNKADYSHPTTVVLGRFAERPSFEQIKAQVHESDRVIYAILRDDTEKMKMLIGKHTTYKLYECALD